MEMTEETVTCSSYNIYPVPQVTWATDPPSAQEALENSTIKTTDYKGLFNVESTLRILGNLSNYTYYCSFIAADKTQVWIASWKNQGVFSYSMRYHLNCISYQFKQTHVYLLSVRGYNTGRGSRSVHPVHRPRQFTELLPHLDLHFVH